MDDSNAGIAWRLFHLNWIPIAAMSSILLLGVILWDFSIGAGALTAMVAIGGELALISYLYAFLRGDRSDPKLIFSFGALSQLILVITIMGPLTYVAGAANWPLQDHALLAIDRAMGMDPEVIARYVNDHPALADVLQRGYGLIKWPLLLIPLTLGITLKLVRLQLFVFAFSVALIITVTISTFTPAIGTYYGLNISPSQFSLLDLSIYEAQLRDILALRDGSLRHLELFQLAGIVSFPSFHAASAVIYMWALWPVRRIGAISAALNLLMIAGTPVGGAHYVIDVIGGIAVAVISIALAKQCLQSVMRSRNSSQSVPMAPATSVASI